MNTDGRRILVVEDHGPLRAAIRDILEIEGYAIFTAIDGAEALDMMDSVRPNLIVSDILMPCLGGYEFHEAVQARPEWASIPFVLVTSQAGKRDIQKGKRAGAAGYITKPFDPQDLVVMVHSLLKPTEPSNETLRT